jgi:hypothetical protein
MPDWRNALKGNPLPWMLEPENPSIRYWTLVDILGLPADAPEVLQAQGAIPIYRPVRRILDAQYPKGYWMHEGVGYSPKYKATVWQVIFLAMQGMPRCEPIERACDYVLAHSRLPDGRFSAHKDHKGAFLCLNGNLLQALQWFGYGDHPLVMETREAMVAQIARDHFRCRCNAPGPSRPSRMSDGLPCAWGAVKALNALVRLPAETRTPGLQAAVEAGVHYLLAHDLAQGAYPARGKVSTLWTRLGFPLGYTSDVLEVLDVLARAGYGAEPCLAPAWDLILGKQDEQGRWPLEYTPGRMWTSFGRGGQPSKWVTLRALRALKAR